MASSLGIRCGVGSYNNPLQRNKLLDVTNTNPSPNQVSCLMISSSNQKPKKGRILMSMSHQPNMLKPYVQKQEQSQSQSIAYERLDQWMKESVVEIVKNLREAPLLLHVYNKDKKTTTETAVVEEEWPVIMNKWVNKEAEKPEGVIFVEKLAVVEEEEEEEEEVVNGLTRVWGVVVQGRGVECGPACYLLKTSRVGPACYFCLVRVKSFRETAKKQLDDCWLVQRERAQLINC